MDAKLSKIDELSNFLEDKDAVARDLLSLSGKFQLGRIAKNAGFAKEKGVPCKFLLLYLLLIRICKITIFSFFKVHFFGLLDSSIGKNCFYRFINNERYDWRKLQYGVAKSYVKNVEKETSGDPTCKHEVEKLKFFIADDTTTQKTGKKMEGIGKVYDHTAGEHVLGYKVQALSYFDGKGFIPVDNSIHIEKRKDGKQGMSKTELQKRFSKKRDPKSPGHKRVAESKEEKPKTLIQMVKRAWKNGFHAAYLLIDSWYDGLDFIREIRKVGNGALHILCMAKNGNRKYTDGDRHHTVKQMIVLNERHAKLHRKYKCLFFIKDVMLDDIPVRLFIIKYGRKREWNVLLTTDRTLTFVKAFEYYQIRWNTEVMFRECKQHLGLGHCQSNDFDALVADTTLAFITYIMLAFYKRINEYETMGELFRSLQEEVFALTLWQRFLPVVERILRDLCSLLEIDYDETMRTICLDNTKATRILHMLRAADEVDSCKSAA